MGAVTVPGSHGVVASLLGQTSHSSHMLAHLQAQPFYVGQVSGCRAIPARTARFSCQPVGCGAGSSGSGGATGAGADAGADTEAGGSGGGGSDSTAHEPLAQLSRGVQEALSAMGIKRLFSHQVLALRSLLSDAPHGVVHHAVITTPTSRYRRHAVLPEFRCLDVSVLMLLTWHGCVVSQWQIARVQRTSAVLD